MMKTFAAVLAVLLLLVLFHAQVKAFLLELRMDMALARLELDDERLERLEEIVDRVARGYRESRFNDTEKTTLQGLLRDVRRASELSDQELALVISKLEAVLQRNDL